MIVRVGAGIARVSFSTAAAVWLGAASASALDPRKAITQYVIENWGTEDGLPSPFVRSIAQTPDGYLWLATQRGLVRFDGTHFTTLDRRTTPELGSQDVSALLVTRDGSLWIGTGNGLVQRHGGGYTVHSGKLGLSDENVRCLLEDREGGIWIGTWGGLARFDRGRFTVYTTRDGLVHDSVNALAADTDGSVWVGTRGGLSRRWGGRFTSFTTREGLASDVIHAIHRDRKGSLWVATFSGLNRMGRDGRIETFTTAHGLSHDLANSLAEDPDGNMWVGTYGGGLNRLHEGRFARLTQKEGLADDLILALHLDREGSLWVGTDQAGLVRLKDGPLTSLTTREGLSHDAVRAVLEDGAGTFWVATQGGGLNRVRGSEIRAFRQGDGLPSDMPFSLWPDRAGGLWIGTYRGGLARYDGTRFTTFDHPELPRNQFVTAMVQDRAGVLWLGTYGGGLKRLKEGRMETFRSGHTGSDTIWAIAESRDGALWIGTDGGLARFGDGAFRRLGATDGLPGETTWCVYEDDAGGLWAGTETGLVRYKDGRFVTLTSAHGLLDDEVTLLAEDARGFLWLGSSRGLSRVPRALMDELAEGRRARVSPVHYGVADGMKSPACSGSTQPAVWRARDGRLWLATEKGVVIVDPDRLPALPPPPPPAIDAVLVDGRPLSAGGEVGADGLRFEFRYSAPYLSNPGRLRFRYRLDGVDADWVAGGTGRVAHYTSVPPGQHRFRVLAGHDADVWNAREATFDFHLRPHFWQTAWFYSLSAVAVGLTGWAGHRYRVRRLLEVERMRTRIARDLHDDIGSTLSQIAILSEVARRKAEGGEGAGAAEPLERIGALSRASVEAMGDIVWAIDPQKDRLLDLAQRLRSLAGEVLDPAGIEFSFPADEAPYAAHLGADVRREVFLVLKESLNNVVRHAEARHVDVSLKQDDGRLVLLVSDDGHGFDPAVPAEGNGLGSMKRRAEVLGGRLEIRSAPGRGTTVSLIVPFKRRRRQAPTHTRDATGGAQGGA